MRSFIKIYGPPLYEAIKKLEGLSIDMPEVCIMDSIVAVARSETEISGERWTEESVMDYFTSAPSIPLEVTRERCSNIISGSHEMLGEYDFFFEWFTKPSMEQLNELIKKIDEALTPLGCKYTITTKE